MDKVVILARGLGKRMRRDSEATLGQEQAAVAATGIKALIPIDRPFLDYALSALADAGYRRVCLVIGPEHDAIRQYYGVTIQPRRLSIEFAVQDEPRGTADAVRAAESFAAGDPFLVLNSDNYYPAEALCPLRDLTGPGTALFDAESMVAHSNTSQDRLRHYAVGVVDGEGCLSRIVEKPDEPTWQALPRPVLISMNCWRFGPEIFEACRAIRPSARGEFEIVDAVQHTIDALDQRYRVIPVKAGVLDLSSRQDIGPVTERLRGTRVEL